MEEQGIDNCCQKLLIFLCFYLMLVKKSINLIHTFTQFSPYAIIARVWHALLLCFWISPMNFATFGFYVQQIQDHSVPTLIIQSVGMQNKTPCLTSENIPTMDDPCTMMAEMPVNTLTLLKKQYLNLIIWKHRVWYSYSYSNLCRDHAVKLYNWLLESWYL